MKKFMLFFLWFILSLTSRTQAANFLVTQASNGAYSMPTRWQDLLVSMGHTVNLQPISILNSNTFFSTTDVLIVSDGIANYTATQKATILAFVQSGKPVYLQSEYLSSYQGNQAFAQIVNALGSSFTWGATQNDQQNPVVSGSYATTNMAVTSLPYYWYGCTGTGGTGVYTFLRSTPGNVALGWSFCPANTNYGKVITTSDQDWIQNSPSYTNCVNLMKNIVTHLLTPSLCGPTFSLNISAQNNISCNGGSNGSATVSVSGGTAPFTYSWSPSGGSGASISGRPAGTYTCTVTDGSGVSNSISVILTQPSAALSATGSSTMPCGNTATGSATVVVSGGTPGYTYSWSPSGGTGATASNLMPNTYTCTYTDSKGCFDSRSFIITANPLPTATQSASICASQLPYTWNGLTVTAGGTVAAVYHTPSLVTGCDSTTTLNLTVKPLLTATQSVSICASQLPYTWNGITLTAGGSAVAVYHTPSLVSGCDSATTLNLTVKPLLTATQSVSICTNQLPYTWNGITVTAGGSGVAVYHTPSLVSGCDSATTLNLTVKSLVTATQSVSICASQLPYTWNGITLTAGGSAVAVYHTPSLVSGCDSATTLNLTVKPLLTATQSVSICASQLPYTWNGITVTVGGAAAAVYHTPSLVSGCDSATTLNLTVKPLLTATQSISICASQLPYTWNGITVTAGGAAAAVYHTPSLVSGCDSATTLNLTVKPLITATQPITICASQLPYTWNGINVTAGGAAAAVYHTPSLLTGCDSATTLNLTVNPLPVYTKLQTICANQLPYTWNGITVTAGGPAVAVYHTPSLVTGCDSTTTLNLTVNPMPVATQQLTICASQLPYTWNGIVVTAGGTAVATYHTPSLATGCDSTTTLNLTVTPQATPAFTGIAPICQGMAISLPSVSNNSINGSWSPAINNMATTAYTFTPTTGVCAFTANMTVTVRPVTYGTQTAIICNGETYVFNGISHTTSNTTAKDTLINSVGCDSVITLNLTVMPVNPVAVTEQLQGCGQVVYAGQAYTSSITLYDTFYTQYGCDSIYRQVQITVFPEYHYMVDQSFLGCGSYRFNNKTYLESTVVQDTLYTVMGCDSVYRTTNIEIEHFDLQLDYTPDNPYEGEYITLRSSDANGLDYQVMSWSPANLFEQQHNLTQQIKLYDAATISVIGITDKGCKDTARVQMEVRPYKKDMMMPNAFTPNGDGRNDVFKPVMAIDRAYTILEFRVFNRWGQTLYAASNLNNGWDGTYKGVLQAQGVYHYALIIQFVDGTRKTVSGDVTLLQ